MNAPREDDVWKMLLARSAPTYAVADAPPFGLATRVLAAARGAEMQEAIWERIGRRAIYAALGTVLFMSLITFAHVRSPDDTDSSLRGFVQFEDAVVS